MEVLVANTPTPPTIDFDAIPQHDSDAMCRTLICTIDRLLQNPKIKADYDRWKRERDSRPKQ